MSVEVATGKALKSKKITFNSLKTKTIKMKIKQTFKNIEINSRFYFGGNEWVKKSTRTAQIIKPKEYSDRWFYFGKEDICTIKNQ